MLAEDGKTRAGSVLIIDIPSRKEAERFSANEIFRKAGLFERAAINRMNYEAGGEANILDDDPASEGRLNDIGFPPVPGTRHPLVESAFEYGSREGITFLHAYADVPG